MFGLIWRLIVIASVALAASLGWGWYSSYKQSDSAYALRGTRYLQATSHRGRADLFWIDNYPQPEGDSKDAKPVRGYVRGAIGEKGEIKGAATFRLKEESKTQHWPIILSEGTVQFEIEKPRQEPVRPAVATSKPRSIVITGGHWGVTANNPAAERKRTANGGAATDAPALKYRSVSVPHWAVLAVVSLPWVLAFIPIVKMPLTRAQRRRYGQCVGCGYDLRGDFEGRCPQCGKIKSR